MTLTVKRPTRALTSWYEPEYLDKWLKDVWESWTPSYYRDWYLGKGWWYGLDMYELKDELVLKLEFPGIKKEDVDISLEGDYLTIKVDKKMEEISKEATYYSRERCYGEYSRTVMLPFPVEADKISATYENGLLEIRLPKAEEAKSKHIEVKVK